MMYRGEAADSIKTREAAQRRYMSALPRTQPEIAMKKGLSIFFTLLRDESGQDLIEYAVVAGLIGLGAVISMTNLTLKIRTAFSSIGSQLTSAT